MKNRRRDVEPLEKRVVAALKDSYELGYSDGIEDENVRTNTFTKKLKEAYNNGLNDAWECAKKIYDFSGGELSEIFPESKEIPFYSYSASEAIARIKEYEEQQKQDTKEKIKIGDEVTWSQMDGTGIVIQKANKETIIVLSTCMDGLLRTEESKVVRTGRYFPQIAEVLKLL